MHDSSVGALFVPDTGPMEESDTEIHGHSWDQRREDDLRERWLAGNSRGLPTWSYGPHHRTMISAEPPWPEGDGSYEDARGEGVTIDARPTVGAVPLACH
jgi:hypothetical protein